MSRFTTRLYNAEDGTRTFAVYGPDDIIKPLMTFNVNVLEDMRLAEGDVPFVTNLAIIVGDLIKDKLTPAEIEYLVEDL
jgi:hypothetical protein